jgi:hypothetical protein
MLNENEQKKRLAQGVWLDEVERSFRAWRSASQADKNNHLLSGMTLTWAESWRLTSPGDFSPATHTFIARSVAVQALKTSGEREASAAETRRRDKVYQQILLLMALFAIVILAPGTMRLYLDHDGGAAPSSPQVAAGQPAAAAIATAPLERLPTTAVPAALPVWAPQSPAFLIGEAETALRQGNRNLAGRLALEAVYSAPSEALSSEAASLLAALTQEKRPAPADQSAFVGAERLRACGGTGWLARKDDKLLMLDTADGQIKPVAVPATLNVGNLTAAAIDPACQSVLVTNEDYDVALEQIGTQAARRRLGGHDAPVVALSFSGDGKRAVSISRDGVGKVWDVAARRVLSRFRTPQSTFNGAAIDHSGASIVTWSDSSAAELWDAATGAAKGTLKGHVSTIASATFATDGALLLTVSTDGTANIWANGGAAVIATLRPQEGAILSARFLPDAQRVVALLEDNKLVVWDPASKQQPKPIETPDLADTVVVSPDGRLMAIADRDGMVVIWDSTTGATRFMLAADADTLAIEFTSPVTLRAIGVTATSTWSLPLTRNAAVAAVGGASHCLDRPISPWCAASE